MKYPKQCLNGNWIHELEELPNVGIFALIWDVSKAKRIWRYRSGPELFLTIEIEHNEHMVPNMRAFKDYVLQVIKDSNNEQSKLN